MNVADVLAVNVAATFALMFLLWGLSVKLMDVSIVDVFWGIGFAIIATTTYFLTGAPSGRKTLTLTLTCVWGLRLAGHLALRKFGAPEDDRYRSMRQKFGPGFWLSSLGIVFGLQAVIMLVVALPVVLGQFDRAPLGLVDALGASVWGVGFLFESMGDWQLARFKSEPDNAGKVLDSGLWGWTRHPNYFGDFLVWWGLYIVAIGSGDAAWTIVSPLLMSFLLMRVSGVTLLESKLLECKPEYAEYTRRTSAFFPWPPRPKAPQVSQPT